VRLAFVELLAQMGDGVVDLGFGVETADGDA
jgi:hypothetical protein